MKCLLCESFSLLHICKNCQESFLSPSIYKRKVDNIDVISFYKYSDIKDLIHTKHTEVGYYIFNILAQNSFKKFATNFSFDTQLNSIAIDDKTISGYSHTAILNKSLKSKYILPLHSKLHAKNNISYSGKSKEFRKNNPREFQIKDLKDDNLILVDDIITTGSTLSEAIRLLKRNNKNIFFCLTLADAT